MANLYSNFIAALSLRKKGSGDMAARCLLGNFAGQRPVPIPAHILRFSSALVYNPSVDSRSLASGLSSQLPTMLHPELERFVALGV